MNAGNPILADGRWAGEHGIGRFTTEVFSRLQNITIQRKGPKPLSLMNLIWQSSYLMRNKNLHSVYFNPGFNALLYSPIPFIFIIHDLNHLHYPHNAKFLKKIYYHTLLQYTARRAFKILTPSHYSKKTILEWINLPDDKIQVVGSGVGPQFTPKGKRHTPGYPYLLHVGNTKVHKNVSRIIQALTIASIDSSIKLVLTGEKTSDLAHLIKQMQLTNRVIFSGKLTEDQLANYYRGATGIVFPSLYEGFGLPVIEGMACGIPVLTSNVTSLPEIAGDAAILVDPYEVNAIAEGMNALVNDNSLRTLLIARGYEQAKLFSWDRTATLVQSALDAALGADI